LQSYQPQRKINLLRHRNVERKELTLSHREECLLCLKLNEDVTLMVPHTFEKTGKRFFISTSILSVASEYHDRLFNERMLQAHGIPNRRSVSLNLNEEDLQALEVILRAFHYQMTAPLMNSDSSLITKIALHADK
jgi:hypothetical protein